MITKKLTAFMTAFALLFTLVQFNTGMEPAAESSAPVITGGRLVLFDFGTGSDANLGTDTADAYRELSTEVCDTGKSSSLLWTFPQTANLNVEVHLDYQRKDWPEGADVKFRMYNGHTEDNTFVLYFYTLSSDYTPISRSFITLKPGWNTVTMSRSALDSAIPLENDIGVKFNVGGWRKSNPYVYTVGSKIYIDSAYIEYPGYGETVSAPTPTIENGAGYVASDLGNNNTYTLTFSEKLWDGSHTDGNTEYTVKDYVTVYEKNGSSYVETSQNYDVLVNSDGALDIIFDTELNDAIYKVVANSDAILTSTGKKLAEDAEFYFSVGMESVLTPVVGSDGVIFEASNEDDLNGVPESNGTSFSFKHVAEGAFLGVKTLKITKNIENSNPFGKDISNKVISDITKYNYINCLIYSPQVSEDGLTLMLTDTRGTETVVYKNTITFNWQGWKTVYLPISGIAGDSGSYVNKMKFDFNRNGSNWKSPSYVLVDRVWLSDSIPMPAELAASEYEDGEYNIDADLGGDNTYSFTFTNKLCESDISDAVSVRKRIGSSYEAFTSYEVSVSDDVLDISFVPGLSGNQSFDITLDLSKIMSADFVIGSGIITREFTVGGYPAYFVLKSASVEDGAVIDDMSEIELTFNNKIDSSLYVPEYIYVYKDGNGPCNVYEWEVSDNKLKLIFNDGMESGSYTIKIASGYKDVFGNSFSGNNALSFTYEADGAGADTYIVFTAEKEENFERLANKFSKVSDITNLYDQTAKLAFTAGTGGSTNVDGHINRGVQMNTVGMKYLNLIMYSPKETENMANIALYTDYANNQYGGMKYVLPLDWSGWKLVSIPMSSFVGGDTYNQLLFNVGGWSYKDIYEDSYVLFDAIWFSKEQPSEFKLLSSDIAGGYESADICGEIVKLKFSADIDTQIMPEIVFADSAGNPVSDYSYSIDGDTMTFVFGELSPATSYTLTADKVKSTNFTGLKSPVTLKFTTASEGVFADEYSYASATITVKIKNLTGNDKALTFIAYAIGDDNELLEKLTSEFTAQKNTEITANMSFTTDKEIKEVTAFVYDENGRFLSRKVFLLKSGADTILSVSPLAGEISSVKIDSCNLSVNILDASLSLGGVSDAAVIELAKSKGEILYANVVNADSKGNLKFYYAFPESASTGTYTVSAISDNKEAAKDVLYISKADRDRLFGLSKGSDTKALASCISDLKTYLGISGYTDAEISDLAKLMTDNADFASYPEVYDFIQFYDKLIADINKASWGELTEIINKNSEVLGGKNNDAVSKFVSLSTVNQNKVSQKLISGGLSVDTVAEFLSVLSDALEDADTPQKQPSTGSSSGSGSSFGGGSGSASFPAVPDAKPYTPIEEDTVFTDLGAASWATDSIMTLYKKGVISPAADNKFRPGDMVTREEFVKMIVCAFLGNADYASHRFADEADGAWYSLYLSKAYHAGIALGYPDGRFGVGENITREDMVTICSRTLESLGKNINTSADSGFSDASSISDYAYGYVNAMAKLGVVNGVGDGTFAPKKNATRAEAAKVIAKLSELY